MVLQPKDKDVKRKLQQKANRFKIQLIKVCIGMRIMELEGKLRQMCHVLSEHSRTSRLWLLYMECTEAVKLFLTVERTSIWQLQLHLMNSLVWLVGWLLNGPSTQEVIRANTRCGCSLTSYPGRSLMNRMLSLLAASSHGHYSKSAPLYLQTMQQLLVTHP
jgi:hypothetical protein